MERNNMKREKHTRRNSFMSYRNMALGLILMFRLFSVLHAQDIMPEKARRDHNSGPVYSSTAMENLMKFIPVSCSMPSCFKDTTENVITDTNGSLDRFWEKLSVMDRPVRIVHIGDSHVRGHVFPYIMRKSLEEDFGHEAVIDYNVSYHTSGLAEETGKPGIVYHILGVNGATCESFNKPERITEITSLNPDLVIMSFGTNEAHGRNYNTAEHRIQMKNLIGELKKGCTNADFLITTPPGAYVRSGRRSRVINVRTPKVVETEKSFAAENDFAVWNLYDVLGGENFACKNWTTAGMYQRDKIHFTREGYTLQGLLLHEAFIKAYNDYVATKIH